ncbi:Uma2 family endonuclease [Alkalinema pantanalense CENA528]|uniref:Uma2 family endonuclease n=1 Tax=Alkalinema pantanalense TaxID=1620705 RepID=UPI003D6DF5C2
MTVSLDRQIVYPDRDGQPMSDNTKQFRWIVLLKENLECLFAGDAQVFVAGDLLWYPVEGHPEIRSAPDAMVVLGRPKGDRGSYKQWEEGNIAPQVVFEVLSPGNTLKEMTKKQEFYDRYGVEEYYIYDPDRNDFNGLVRVEGQLRGIDDITDWQSPRLGIRFVLTQETLEVYYPDGRRFLTTVELAARAEQAEERAEQAELQLEEERSRSARLAEQLKALGIDPDSV